MVDLCLSLLEKLGGFLNGRHEMEIRDMAKSSLLIITNHYRFSDGCDSFVLLDDTINFMGEKNGLPNRNSLRGFEVIDKIKADVERACPSCVDILVLAAKEAAVQSGGPFWYVPLSRRDGLTASEKAENEQLPSFIEPIENITAKFVSKGLDFKGVVVLSVLFRLSVMMI